MLLEITQPDVSYRQLCFIILTFPIHIFIAHYCKLNYIIIKLKNPWATGMAELCCLGIETMSCG